MKEETKRHYQRCNKEFKQSTVKAIDNIIDHLKLRFQAERPPPPQVVQQQLLTAA